MTETQNTQNILSDSFYFFSCLPNTATTSFIGVGAGKCLWGRRIFARILPNLPKRSPKKVTSKQSLACDFGRHFFQIKAG